MPKMKLYGNPSTHLRSILGPKIWLLRDLKRFFKIWLTTRPCSTSITKSTVCKKNSRRNLIIKSAMMYVALFICARFQSKIMIGSTIVLSSTVQAVLRLQNSQFHLYRQFLLVYFSLFELKSREWLMYYLSNVPEYNVAKLLKD